MIFDPRNLLMGLVTGSVGFEFGQARALLTRPESMPFRQQTIHYT